MAARKLEQEIQREFKTIKLGLESFDTIYEKLQQSTNQSQKNKLEDDLKTTIKKLQRSRDKVKGWASSNDIKDKTQLLEQRRLIEQRMESFKAVEKEMKTKAFSKEGLSAAAKMDPKEREKTEVSHFLGEMVEELGRQIEHLEAEADQLRVTLKKKKKNDAGKVERLAELERTVERHKWHTGRLEIVLRLLENGSIEADEVKEIEEGIRYYVEQNQELDFAEDDDLYEGLNLDQEEEFFGVANENDAAGQDETADDAAEDRPSGAGDRHKAEKSGRRASAQLSKSPLPVLSLHATAGGKAAADMKPAPLPSIPTGQTLKYASAAAAAAASERNSVGIAPLPPPPGAKQSQSPSPTDRNRKKEPARTAHPKTVQPPPQPPPAALTPAQQPQAPPRPPSPSPPSEKEEEEEEEEEEEAEEEEEEEKEEKEEKEVDVQRLLPTSLSDVLETVLNTRQQAIAKEVANEALMAASRLNAPTPADAERPRRYTPDQLFTNTPAHYPQYASPVFDDQRLYNRIDTDSLFYAFYYRQGTYHQYQAAKALKNQSWRFHKQYQTWFQRHEEPKSITDDYEQGTYRFFDYESTWMNRRKTDFVFHYRFLEDEL
ncbi:hypothetical protein K470DRAFT_299318 [Piedraia hortae CBS 480.64]|uniref:General negative regulator of transcription subunit n=1 Tax=Piedraia hortae CBS 480.64 TaxID=1314780 RepID=A0A6A7C1W0_9PEZI|nr:hypothetical protein K470DRAFT_299318 [Piedraia hortae CBS 480.64]